MDATGTLVLFSGSDVGGTIALEAGSTLGFTSSFRYGGAITIAGDPDFDVAAGQTATISSAIADGTAAGELVMDGTGTLTLYGQQFLYRAAPPSRPVRCSSATAARRGRCLAT